MERLPKIAILMGMSIALFVFGLFLYVALPDLIRYNNWDEFTEPIDEKMILEKFHTNEAYLIFIEKYPENGEIFRPQDNRAELRVNAMNFTSLTQIELELDYNSRDDYFRQNVDCRNDQNDWRLRISGPLAAQFLENVDCLAMGTFTGKSSELLVYEDADASYASSFAIIEN